MNGPLSLGDLFGNSRDEKHSNDVESESEDNHNEFKQNYELQDIKILDKTLKIRQFSWHQTNANQVWPGTFRLAEFIVNHIDKYNPSYKSHMTNANNKSSSFPSSCKILELGAATGALSIFLKQSPYFFDMLTSDIDDGGEVYENLCFNYELNGLTKEKDVFHIPFTWGSNWQATLEKMVIDSQLTEELKLSKLRFKFIFASDILLYVSVYEQLVASLVEMFQDPYVEEFLMSWNRRIPESKIFFDLMNKAGFQCVHHGHCIYSFTFNQMVPISSDIE